MVKPGCQDSPSKDTALGEEITTGQVYLFCNTGISGEDLNKAGANTVISKD